MYSFFGGEARGGLATSNRIICCIPQMVNSQKKKLWWGCWSAALHSWRLWRGKGSTNFPLGTGHWVVPPHSSGYMGNTKRISFLLFCGEVTRIWLHLGELESEHNWAVLHENSQVINKKRKQVTYCFFSFVSQASSIRSINWHFWKS